jgi:hypothetical protein
LLGEPTAQQAETCTDVVRLATQRGSISQQALPPGNVCQGRPIRDIEEPKQPRYMPLRGALADPKLSGDLLGRPACGNQLDNFTLTTG